MAGTPNCHRSKQDMVQINRFVLRWFSLSEAPQETRSRTTATGTYTARPSKMPQSQRNAVKTKRKHLFRGVTNNSESENKEGLETAGASESSEVSHAAVTVNLISSQKRADSDEEMELIGEDIEGEKREATGAEENDDRERSDVETLDFLTESSSEVSNEPILLPNILIPCTKCGDVINICRLPGHRNLHAALQVFKYSHDQRPKNLKALVRRRKLLIKQQLDASSRNIKDPFGDKHLHKLNSAFEVLKIELEGNIDARSFGDENIEEIKLTGEGFDMSCTTAVGVCEEANKKWKNMEDVHTFKDNFLENIDSAFFAIYDGYSGKHTADKCSRHLHVFLKEELDSIITQQHIRLTKRQVTAAFRNSFSKTERLLALSEEERSQSRWSGCSAVTCVLSQDTCFIANAGNVGAVLLRDNDIVKVLTHKHDLYNKKERDRVRKSSGVIVKTEKCALINGALGVTRGIGSIGDMALKRCVINEPDVKSVLLDPTDQLLIVASGGFWKLFSYEETIHLVNGFFGQMRKEAKKQIIGAKKRNKTTSKTSAKDIMDTGNSKELFFKVADPANESEDTAFFSSSVKTGYFTTSERVIARSKSEENFDKLSMYHQKITQQGSDTRTPDISDETTHANEFTSPDDVAIDDVGSISAAHPGPVFPPPRGMSAGSFSEKRLVIEPIDDVTLKYLRHHRFSLPDDKTFQLLKDSGEKELTRDEKVRLLAKCLAERLVKCALYAQSMDNITVFVVLLPGFSMINWQMVRPDILEALNEFVDEDDLY